MDITTGTIVQFTEGVFGGSWRKPRHLGDRTIIGKIVKESYGAKRGQHTFTIEVQNCTGFAADEVLNRDKICRKGRNVYKNCIIIERPQNHCELAAEKHARAAAAKQRKHDNWHAEGKLHKLPAEYWS